MRKFTFLAIIFLLLATLSASAQSQREKATPKERAARMVERLHKELQLTDKQKTDLKNWYETSLQKVADTFKKEGDREAKRKVMKENQEANDAQLKKTLTADQYKKYKENEEKRRKAMKNRKPAF